MNTASLFRIIQRTVILHTRYKIHQKVLGVVHPFQSLERIYWFIHPQRALRLYVTGHLVVFLWSMLGRIMKTK